MTIVRKAASKKTARGEKKSTQASMARRVSFRTDPVMAAALGALSDPERFIREAVLWRLVGAYCNEEQSKRRAR